LITLKTILSNSLLFASCLYGTIRWRKATHRVASVQARYLQEVLAKNAETTFGREHGFSTIHNIRDYQQHVQVREFTEMEPYIQRMAAGERDVLTADQVKSFALSSGSSAASKMIPYTPSLLCDFRRGITPWMGGLFLEYPSLLLGQSYWQVSPVGTDAGMSSGGIRIGFGEDSEYFGPFRGALVRATLAVPEHVAGIAEMDSFRFETLSHLLACDNLRFISIWNPSFFTLLLAEVRKLLPSLLLKIGIDGSAKRARQLQRLFNEYSGADFTQRNRSGHTLGEAIWPKLRVISCWSDAGAREAALRLKAAFPSAAIQPKGLLATEGMMSLPWRAEGSALAICSHFFEFVETGTDTPRLAHELETGRTYAILLTTSGGFYRYRIGDLVEVTGWIDQCPLLRFRGKENGVSDMVGEKLNGLHAVRAAEELLSRYGTQPTFWMLAPEHGEPAPCYTLYIQSQSAVPRELISELDAELRKNFHYAYAQRLGQLCPLKLFVIDPESSPELDYMQAQAARGRRMGGIKRQQFEQIPGWSTVFRKDVKSTSLT
jgi:hypothetical protein